MLNLNTKDWQQRVRERAYRIWQRNYCAYCDPLGFWQMAIDDLYNDLNRRIQDRAFEIWERLRRPREDRCDEIWGMAQREISAEDLQTHERAYQIWQHDPREWNDQDRNWLQAQEEVRTRNHRIRQRAHEIWEKAGRPHGRALEHWLSAEQEIDAKTV